MEFQKITVESRQLLDRYLKSADELTCEISMVNLLIWQPLYNNEFCIEDGILYLRSSSDCMQTYSLPFGDIKKGMNKIIQECGNNYPDIWAQAGERFEQFKSLYGQHYNIIESRNEFDYIYKSEKLITLSGKKLHSKRNHISSFSKQYAWSYQDITSDNADAVLKCADKWYRQNGSRIDEELKTERKGIALMLDNMHTLDIKGGAISVGGEIVAFTLGSPINDRIYNVHIEKAVSGFETAYTVINREFAARNLREYEYVNREDDLGLEGLRRSKLSYHPDILLPKYICTKKVDL